MSEYQRLARHSSHYFLAQLAFMAASFISLPILARVLPKEDYGRLGLILLSVNLLTTFARLGIPQSIVRFYPERAAAGAEAGRRYVSTVFWSAILIAGVATVVVPPCASLFPPSWGAVDSLLWFVGVLVGAEVVTAVVSETYRAQQRTALVSALRPSGRVVGLAASLAFFYGVSASLPSFLAGRVFGLVGVLLLFVAPLVRSRHIGLPRIEWPDLGTCVRYGLPLSLATSAGFFIDYGDRYVIQLMRGAADVAVYSVPYDMLYYLVDALTTPLRMAIVPILFTLLAAGESERASELLGQALRGVLFVAVPLGFGLWFLGRDILIVVASEKYAESHTLLPLLAPGIIVGGLNFLLVVGLTYQRRTGVIAAVTVAAGVFNLILNLFFVPRFGLVGAAWATLLSYVLHSGVSYWLSARFLAVRLFPASLAAALAASSLMVAVLWVSQPLVPHGLLPVALLITLGVATYVAGLLILDADVRRYARLLVRQRRLAPWGVA
jgi:O-antigen/teichoic acid export membrane protein